MVAESRAPVSMPNASPAAAACACSAASVTPAPAAGPVDGVAGNQVGVGQHLGPAHGCPGHGQELAYGGVVRHARLLSPTHPLGGCSCKTAGGVWGAEPPGGAPHPRP